MNRSIGALRRLCRQRVMIVEDEVLLAENIAFYLGAAGALVAIAHSGERALLDSESFAPQCLIVDYNLPGMNGIETVRRFRERDPDTRCILITGQGSEEVLAAARSHGIERVLTKPFPLYDICSGCDLNCHVKTGAQDAQVLT